MDALTCSKEAGMPFQSLGGKFMLDPATFGTAPEVGMEPSVEYYALGRFGPLAVERGGEVSGAEAADLMFFSHPETFSSHWENAIQNNDPKKVGDRFLQCCIDWGRKTLGAADIADAVEVISRVGGKIVDEAPDPGYAPLFSVLRRTPRPDDAPAAAALAANFIRELRFAHHVQAVKADSMDPLEAMLTTPGGENTAAMFLWPQPYPEVTDELAARRAAVEERTSELSAEDFTPLTDEERQELADAVKKVAAFVESS